MEHATENFETEYDRAIAEKNKKLLESIGASNEDYESVLFGSHINGAMEVVDKPSGDNQEEDHGFFTDVWVDQWSVGMDGDSFEGFIYAKFGDEKYLKIPYSC